MYIAAGIKYFARITTPPQATSADVIVTKHQKSQITAHMDVINCTQLLTLINCAVLIGPIV